MLNKLTHFNYVYDKQYLLEKIYNNMNLMDHIIFEPREDNIGGQDNYRIRVHEHLDNLDMKIIYDNCIPIIDFFGSKKHHVKIQHYESDSHLSWHYDHPMGSGITKVNLLLTEPRAFEDRDGNTFEFDTCIVNSTMFEHQMNNRGKPKRTFIRIGLQDINYYDAVLMLADNGYEIQNTNS